MTVVGISGHFSSGKDTVAQRLITRHGFVRVGFSDSLKYEVATTLRKTLLAYATERSGPISLEHEDRVIRELLWVNRTTVTRALLQEWGTELRRTEDPDYWIRAWQEAARRFPRVVVPDVRFPNEAVAIRAAGGRLVLVKRPDRDGDEHASETALVAWEDWDHVFINDGTIADLHDAVDAWWFAAHLTSPDEDR